MAGAWNAGAAALAAECALPAAGRCGEALAKSMSKCPQRGTWTYPAEKTDRVWPCLRDFLWKRLLDL